MPLELIGGKLVLVEQRAESATHSLTVEEIQRIIDSAILQRRSLTVPNYVPDKKKDVVQEYLTQLVNEVWMATVERWRVSAELKIESLLTAYNSAL